MIDFRLFGIKFSVSMGFMCVITLSLYIDKTGLMLPTLEAVLLHEMGHILALKLMKAPPQTVSLKIGSIALSGRYILTVKKEILMLFMGPLANILAALFLFLGYKYSLQISLLNRSLIMLIVGIFNLLPIMGLDGGDIVGAVLQKNLKLKTAQILMKAISVICVLCLFMFGVYVLCKNKSNPSLLLLSIYLLLCTFKMEK